MAVIVVNVAQGQPQPVGQVLLSFKSSVSIPGVASKLSTGEADWVSSEGLLDPGFDFMRSAPNHPCAQS